MTNGQEGYAQPVLIRTHNLTKRFGEMTAVRDLNFTIPQGSIFGFIGPSGCGKTTTMRLLLGIYDPSEGEATVFDHSSQKFGRYSKKQDLMEIKTIARVQLSLALNNIRRIR